MALKTILDDLSEAPDGLQGEYKEQKIGEKTVYVLDLEGVDSHPAVVNLKTAHDRVKADKAKLANDLRDATAKLTLLPEDFDADEWSRLKTEDEARANDPDNKNVRAQIDAATNAVKTQYEAKLDRQKKDYDANLAEKDADLVKRDAEIRRRVGTDSLRAALTSAGVKKGLIAGAVAMFDRDIEVIQEDDAYVARMKADLGGDDVERFISNWAQSEAAKEWIAPPTGDDEPGSTRSRMGLDGNPFSKQGWNKTAQASLIASNRAKAEQMAKSAGFKSLEATFSARGPLAA